MKPTTTWSVDTAVRLEAIFASYRPFDIRYAADELICQSGSYAAGIYLVTDGIAIESYVDREAEVVPTDLLGAGDLIGFELLAPDGGPLHCTSCRAVSGVRLAFLERSAFDAAMDDHPALSAFVTAHLAGRALRGIRALWRARLAPSTRVQDLIADLSRFGVPTEDGVALPPELDIRLIADLTALSKRRVKDAIESMPEIASRGDRLVIRQDPRRSCELEGLLDDR